jgi:hypothetical protein
VKQIFLAAVIAFVGSSPATANAIFSVNVTTGPLNGVAGYLAFDFLGGTPIENNTVTISGFTSNAALGALTKTGDAFGTISPGPGTMDDTNFFFNEFLQAVTFGTTISFTLNLTTSGAPSGTPDTFAFYLLDSTQNPFLTSDPTGANSLFSINVTGPNLSPAVYTSSSAAATVTPAGISTPEPGSFWMLGVPLLVLIRARGATSRPSPDPRSLALWVK